MKKVTMDDVAREAGCSRAQVSRMLSGKSYVAEELRVRIQAALKRMNYRNRANRHRIRLAIIVKELIGLFQNRLLDALMKDILRRKWECCRRTDLQWFRRIHSCWGEPRAACRRECSALSGSHRPTEAC